MQEDKPMLFGEPYSVYVRAVRLALEEKNVAYELVPVDTPDFASTKRVRSPDMWTRRFRGLGSNLNIPVPARE